MLKLEEHIGALIGDYSYLEHKIKHLSFDTSSCGARIEVRCSYIAFRGGEPTWDDFIEILSDQIIPFCLPRKEIIEALSGVCPQDISKSTRIIARLAGKARSLFIRAKKGSNRSGEAGEIALYILNEWVLKAPQIVSKMYLKTNTNMPVHGTDGIHARFDSKAKKLIVYWGESKAHKTLQSALTSAFESISEFVTNAHERREIEIVSSFVDLGECTKEAQDMFLRFLDPYDKASADRVAVFSCLLIYEGPALKYDCEDDETEDQFVRDINAVATEFIGGIMEKVRLKGLESKRFEFFLLPVPSVQEFRDKFQAMIGWPDA